MAEVAAAGDPKPNPQNFNEQAKLPEPPQPPPTPQVQSEQVRNAQLGMHAGPKPPPREHDVQAREAHKQAMHNDNERVATANAERAKLAAANARAYREKFAQAAEQQQDRGMGR